MKRVRKIVVVKSKTLINPRSLVLWASILVRRYICCASQIAMGRLAGYARIDSIPVANILSDNPSSAEFGILLQKALALIRKSSCIQDGRVRRYIKAIHNGQNKNIASYNWPSRICTIDYNRLRGKRMDEVETLAAILVHESIHGKLWSAGIKTTPFNVERIEGVCSRVEDRFWRIVKRKPGLRK